MNNSLKMLRRLIGEDIALRWHPGKGIFRIRMDPTQVEQVLTNLCVNARDAITGAGNVVIETRNATIQQEYCDSHPGFLPGDFVVLSVSDSGEGMDKPTLERIFEPFFTTKALGHGTGLGLSTVYGIVRQNKGFINVYSEPGQGTTFRIYLSREEADKTAAIVDQPDDYLSHGGETILVVEDEPSILKITRRQLVSLGYHVLAAAGPTEALVLIRTYQGPIHLLLTDVIMPDMTGPQMVVQALESRPDLRCLFTSGYTANVIAIRGELKAGVHFLAKPFSRRDMGLKILEVLAGRS